MKNFTCGLALLTTAALTPMAQAAQEGQLMQLCIQTTGSESYCRCYVNTLLDHIGPNNIPHVVAATKNGWDEFAVATDKGYFDGYVAAKDVVSNTCKL